MKRYYPIMKLAVLLVLAPVVIYALTLSDTVSLYREYHEVKESAGAVMPADSGKDLEGTEPMLSSGVMMRRLSGVCAGSKVSVGHYSPVEEGREGTLRLVSARLELTGDFIGLLKVLSCIEDMEEIRVSDAGFRTVKEGKNGKTVRLELTMMQVEEHGAS